MTYQYTYFIDRALGKSVGKALQDLGVDIKFHHDYFTPDAPDTEWLPVVSLKRIEKVIIGNPSPFIAKIKKDKRINIWKKKSALRKLLTPD